MEAAQWRFEAKKARLPAANSPGAASSQHLTVWFLFNWLELVEPEQTGKT